jgi:hypothetical protein
MFLYANFFVSNYVNEATGRNQNLTYANRNSYATPDIIRFD